MPEVSIAPLLVIGLLLSLVFIGGVTLVSWLTSARKAGRGRVGRHRAHPEGEFPRAA